MIDRPVIILGGGGHATVILSLLQSLNAKVIGFTNLEKSVSLLNAVSFLGDDSIILKYNSKDIFLALGIGSLTNNSARQDTYEKFLNFGYEFPPIVHSSAIVDSTCNLSSGAQIMAGVILQPHVEIGENSIINTGATIDHHSKIGRHSHIAPRSTICGQVNIGESSFVGAGSTIINNINIGNRAIVGAGCTVIQDVEEDGLALGHRMTMRSKFR
jgi:UDP-perosamine 4-acetyltransferase